MNQSSFDFVKSLDWRVWCGLEGPLFFLKKSMGWTIQFWVKILCRKISHLRVVDCSVQFFEKNMDWTVQSWASNLWTGEFGIHTSWGPDWRAQFYFQHLWIEQPSVKFQKLWTGEFGVQKLWTASFNCQNLRIGKSSFDLKMSGLKSFEPKVVDWRLEGPLLFFQLYGLKGPLLSFEISGLKRLEF